ncbi:MAG: hypothetical protein V4726_05465 [Verrucomicrobiota bacterium]
MQPISNPMPLFLRDSVTNGNPQEQALIRRWWHEEHGANGRLVWEYPLCGRWVDAIWFSDAIDDIMEQSGLKLSSRFPLANSRIVLCEAKHRQVTPELIGQALVYTSFARRAGAIVERTVIFADTAAPDILAAAVDLGLEVILTDMSSAAAPTSPTPHPEFSLP